jgi:phospholipase C
MDCLSGAVSVVDLPDAAHLAAYTKQVAANIPHPAGLDDRKKNVRDAREAFAKIKHVVYIIRENRTYDEVLGDMTEGNGDPKLCLFGQNVTPNAHALARQYVLLDNLYCNGEVSEDGHHWCDAAYATDYTERAYSNSYSGRGEPDDDDGLSDSPAGFLWDNCARHGLTYRAYGEGASFKSSRNAPPVFTGYAALAGHANYAYSQIPWFDGPRDLGRAEIFAQELHDAEKTGDWPQFMVLGLPEDHTQGLDAGAYTPTAHVGENDLALGKIVEAVSKSKFWSSTAIFVIEDDAQNGPDHVDAHRTVGLVISPYVRHGVDSTMYSTASMIRTMEMILGLPPMTQYDADATPMYNSFQPRPVLTAYEPKAAGVDLEAINPLKGAGATASAKLDLSAPDKADPNALNAILWHALKPGVPQPAPVRSASRLW